jgi:hypothetical protein
MKISTLINYMTSIPKNSFSRFQNGEIQTYSGEPLRGNLYLNNNPALNYYIFKPDQIELCFVLNDNSIIGYERFVFNATENLDRISEVGKEYSISQDIVLYFKSLLEHKGLKEEVK